MAAGPNLARPMRAADWLGGLAGRRVDTADGRGSLCGYTSDGHGGIARVLVAFAPDDRREYPASDVRLSDDGGSSTVPRRKKTGSRASPSGSDVGTGPRRDRAPR